MDRGWSVQELNELSARLGDARLARRAETIFRELGRSPNYSVQQLMSMPEYCNILVQSLAQSLPRAQDVARLAKRYGPEHPSMMTAIARKSVKSVEDQVLQVSQSIEGIPPGPAVSRTLKSSWPRSSRRWRISTARSSACGTGTAGGN